MRGLVLLPPNPVHIYSDASKVSQVLLLLVVVGTLLFSLPFFGAFYLFTLPLWAGLALAGVVAAGWSLSLVVFKKERRRAAGASLLVYCLSLLVMWQVTFGIGGLYLKFIVGFPARHAVIKMVESGELQAIRETGYGAKVPLSFPYSAFASSCSCVYLERQDKRLAINFPDALAVTDNYAAFVYVSDDSGPQRQDFGGKVVSYRRLAPHWYYVVFT